METIFQSFVDGNTKKKREVNHYPSLHTNWLSNGYYQLLLDYDVVLLWQGGKRNYYVDVQCGFFRFSLESCQLVPVSSFP